MSLPISQQIEARLTEGAQRKGLSVDALLERLMNEAACGPASGRIGAVILAALQAFPYRDAGLAPRRYAQPVRDVAL